MSNKQALTLLILIILVILAAFVLARNRDGSGSGDKWGGLADAHIATFGGNEPQPEDVVGGNHDDYSNDITRYVVNT